jgi:hypothetical protein
VRTGKKHTQYYVRSLLRFLAGHVVDPATHEVLLPLWLCLISCSSGGRPGGALSHKMTSQSTLKASSTSAVSLRWCTVRGWGIGAGALLHALARGLLPVGSRWLLLRPLRLKLQTLGLKVRPLRLELRAGHLYWHWRPVHREWLENWLGCTKRGLTLLPGDCPENGTFLLPSFSISRILFSMIMALSTMCWKSA